MSVSAPTQLPESRLCFNAGSASLRVRAARAARLCAAAVLALSVTALFGCNWEESVDPQSTSAAIVAVAATTKAHSSQSLTRPEAKRLIAKHSSFPKTVGSETFGIGDHVWCEVPPKLTGDFPSWLQRGLVTMTRGAETVGDNQCRDAHGYHFDVELTTWGKQYIMNQSGGLVDVRSCLEDLGEVTGIATDPGGASAVVEYSLVQHPTPFGDGRCKGTRTENVRFQRYDDGWRVVQ